MIVTTYIHASRDSMWELGEKLGFTGEKLKYFSYACCEVKVTLDVYEETGQATITHVDGRKVED